MDISSAAPISSYQRSSRCSRRMLGKRLYPTTRGPSTRSLRGAAILLLPALADRRPYDAADFNQRFERNGVGRLADAGGASLFHVRDGKVTRVGPIPRRDRALADLGLVDRSALGGDVSVSTRSPSISRYSSAATCHSSQALSHSRKASAIRSSPLHVPGRRGTDP